jgi:hypothetical protein
VGRTRGALLLVPAVGEQNAADVPEDCFYFGHLQILQREKEADSSALRSE